MQIATGWPRHLVLFRHLRGDTNRCALEAYSWQASRFEDKRVLTLAAKLRDAGLDDTAERLEIAYDRETAVLARSITARDDILQVLVDCPEGLCELRAVLLKQQEWRAREGLSA